MATDAAPRLDVKPARLHEGPDAALLDVGWQVTNLTDAPLAVQETWLPHSQFFGERMALSPALELASGDSAIVRRSVRCVAEAGEIVENGFLILIVRFREQRWRVLTRVRVERAAIGSVSIAAEATTVHPVGFARPPRATGPAAVG